MLTSVPPSSGLRSVAPETNRQSYLSFELLEDVMNLPPSKYEEIIERALIMRIGPLVEYAYHHYKGARELLSPFDDNQVVNSFIDTTSFIKTINRQKFVWKNGRKADWQRAATPTAYPLDPMLEHNVTGFVQVIEGIAARNLKSEFSKVHNVRRENRH